MASSPIPSLADRALAWGCSVTTAWRRVHLEGLPVRAPGSDTKRGPARLRVERLLAAGRLNQSAIAEKCGVTRQRVSQIAKSLGVARVAGR